MRLLHPKTLAILASHPEFPKTHIAHCWSEIFKWKANGKPHPKMFIDDDYALGSYLRFVYENGIEIGCNLDSNKINNLNEEIKEGFNGPRIIFIGKELKADFEKYFDSNYLFSDACSLYYKGINIFEDLFTGESQKYIPVISHKEIIRQCTKTCSKI